MGGGYGGNRSGCRIEGIEGGGMMRVVWSGDIDWGVVGK